MVGDILQKSEHITLSLKIMVTLRCDHIDVIVRWKFDV